VNDEDDVFVDELFNIYMKEYEKAKTELEESMCWSPYEIFYLKYK